MNCVKLPNGFVLDLDSVHYIASTSVICHPFTREVTDKSRLILACEGHTTIEIEALTKQINEIQFLVLNNISERVERIEKERENKLQEQIAEDVPADLSMEEVERERIKKALEVCNGNRNHAANRLGISVRTLNRKIKEYKL